MPCASSPSASERYRSRQPPITSKFSSANPAGSIFAWQAAQLCRVRCLSSCWRIVTAPRMSGSMAGTLGGGGGGFLPGKRDRERGGEGKRGELRGGRNLKKKKKPECPGAAYWERSAMLRNCILRGWFLGLRSRSNARRFVTVWLVVSWVVIVMSYAIWLMP